MRLSILRSRRAIPAVSTAVWILLSACTGTPSNGSTIAAASPPAQSGSTGTSEPSSWNTPSPTVPTEIPSPTTRSVTVAEGEEAVVGDLESSNGSWFLVGGLDGEPTVWASTDGQAWNLQLLPELSDRSGQLTAATAYDDGVLAVGWLSQQVGGSIIDRPLIASGRSGGPWQVFTGLPLPADSGGLLTGVAANGPNLAVAGTLSDGSPAAWVSTDEGRNWMGPVGLPGEKGSSVAGIVHDSDQLIAVGEVIAAPSGPAVWRSDDGRRWDVESLDARGSMADLVQTAFGPIAVGHDGDGNAAVWSLDQATAEPLMAPDAGDLIALSPVADSIMVASADSPAGPLWFLTDEEWMSISLELEGATVVRALSGSGFGFMAAGDDGSIVRVWVGSIGQ